jgi:coenzyme Q-binding protein COQ10
MARFSLNRVLPYAAHDLWEMVGDASKYPEFVPWISGLRTYNPQIQSESLYTYDADVSVGFKMLSEHFSTRVTRNAADQTVNMDLLKGPFRHLKGRWRFSQTEQGTHIDLDMDVELKNPFLEAMLRTNFDRAVQKLMQVFEQRANDLYGDRSKALS